MLRTKRCQSRKKQERKHFEATLRHFEGLSSARLQLSAADRIRVLWKRDNVDERPTGKMPSALLVNLDAENCPWRGTSTCIDIINLFFVLVGSGESIFFFSNARTDSAIS